MTTNTAVVSQSAFGFGTVGHFFAAAFSDVHKVLAFAERAIPQVESLAPVVEGVSALIPGFGSTAVTIERAAFSALGVLLAAVNAADAATAEKGLSVPLDAAAITAFKQLIADCKQDLSAVGYKL